MVILRFSSLQLFLGSALTASCSSEPLWHPYSGGCKWGGSAQGWWGIKGWYHHVLLSCVVETRKHVGVNRSTKEEQHYNHVRGAGGKGFPAALWWTHSVDEVQDEGIWAWDDHSGDEEHENTAQVHYHLVEGDIRAGELHQGRSLTEETQDFSGMTKGEAHSDGCEQQTIHHS